ncbi:MAG: hypothetical protein A2Y07_10545 [Planctomycetes bacterium GWF2_50_10]|nr:MAG: hypothetical protein A2Y07_10545 [Planctomycetes bacterium GWF2_50_10]
MKGMPMSAIRLLLAVCLLLPVLSSCRTGAPSSDQQVERLKAQINQNFRDPVPHFQLAQVYQQMGELDKAAYEFDTTLQLDPVNRQAQAAIVKVHRLRGDDDKAADAAKVYMREVAVTPEDSLALGRAFEDAAVSDFALATYEQALRMAPNSAAVYKQLGYYYLNMKNSDMALKNFRRSFELDPYQEDVALELGRLGVKVAVQKPAKQAPAVKKK